ncbi:MAG: DUF5696 domain-containing protein [Clostridia bacterium]|nr:DUF5696 domain-containing protein [Clostridia bacterium]
MIKKITSLLLVLALILSFAGCSAHFTEEGLKTVNATAMGEAYHTSVAENYKSVMKSGLYELLLDEKNCAIALKDTTGSIWYSMPTVSNSVGSVLSVDATDGSKRYYLNSQDNAVALGTASCVTHEDGLEITYNLQDKASNPAFELPITLKISLEDGVLVASVDTSKIETSHTIIGIDILPTFGAVAEPTSGDFILVPDGPGAMIDLSTAGESEYVFDTYGTDPRNTDENPHPALFGAFGLKCGSSAFAGIVTDGDAISKIKATTSTVDNVYASFSYPTNENLEVSYKFISGSAATYASLASMCREQFIRDGMFSTRVVSADKSVPLNVTVVADGSNKYENIEDMMSVLKAKGINDINLRYDNVIRNFKVSKNVGSNKELDSLRDYLSSQGFGFFVTVNFFDKSISNPEKLSSKIISFSKRVSSYNFEGYVIGDVGTTLSSSREYSRQDYAKNIFSQAISISTNKNLMVDHGNLYAVKNANIVSCLPITTSYEESESYTAIPFAQMIFRGAAEYTSPYLNSFDEDSYQKMLLRSLEFGAMPAFSLSFDEDDATYYENWSAKALEAYDLFESAMKEIRGAKMTDHKKLANGLYLSEYNNETYIYVNYTSETAYYNGLTINANSFLRVN